MMQTRNAEVERGGYDMQHARSMARTTPGDVKSTVYIIHLNR